MNERARLCAILALITACDGPAKAPGLISIAPTRALVGDTGVILEIVGAHFTGAATVRVGTTDLTPDVVQDTYIKVRLTASSLAGEGDVPVSVVTAGGVSPPLTLTLSTPTLFKEVSVGAGFACALSVANNLYCWHPNGAFQAPIVQPSIFNTSLSFTHIDVGDLKTCGLSSAKTYCWWVNGFGVTTPTLVSPAPPDLVRLAVYSGSTCGISTANQVWCWGDLRPLGHLTTVPDLVTVSGTVSYCGLTAAGAAWCWGPSNRGQLGGPANSGEDGTLVSDSLTFVSLSESHWHGCGVATNGKSYCWGNNTLGELGAGDFAQHVGPTPVSTSLSFVDVQTGWLTSCGRTAGNDVHCWGNPRDGALGDGSGSARLQPGPKVAGNLAFTSLSLGLQVPGQSVDRIFVCGITTAQYLYCWGYGYRGTPLRLDPALAP
jgi:hypothetical protein